jgi:hypothetical protein
MRVVVTTPEAAFTGAADIWPSAQRWGVSE